MNRATSFEIPRTESPPARLTGWDYFFRALAFASILLFVALAWDLLSHPNAAQFSTPQSPVWFHALFGFVILPLWWLVSVLILWRAPGNLVGRFLLLMMIGALGWQFTFGIGSPDFGSVAFELFLFYWGAIGFPSLIFLLIVFPDGRLYPPRWRPWVFLFAAVKVFGTILELMSVQAGRPIFTALLTINPFFVPAMADYQSWLTATIGSAGPFVLVGVFMGIASLVLRYRASSTQVRQQIKWLIWWAVVFALLMPLYYVVAFGIQIGSAQISILIPLLLYLNLGALLIAAIGIAILRYHLFDIDLILNRTLVYGILTAFVVLAYGLVVGYLSAIFRSDNLLFSLIATGIIAILFQPLRQWLQRAVNRLLYGERDDPYTVLSRLGQRLEAAYAPESVLPMIVETVAQTLKLPYVAIALNQDGEFKIAAEFGRSKSEPINLPLIYQGEPVGELILAPRAPGEHFTGSERQLLDDLARQAGVAAHAVRLTADLQRSRERLVTTREEERRRLRRDLHDGLGPQLASLALKLEAARNRMADDPKAAALLTDLSVRTQEAVADIRRLVYALRPPALDELGLIMALREGATQYNEQGSNGLNITFDVPESLPPLPAAVEVAVYRVVQEALTNVVRHAEAHTCLVRLRLDESVSLLCLDVQDDGRGLPTKRRAGVGLHSMRERAEELGGTLTITSVPMGGTLLTARLPCHVNEPSHLADRNTNEVPQEEM